MNVFDEVKEVLQQNGWCKNNLHNEEGEYCLVGAYCLVRKDRKEYYDNSVHPHWNALLEQLINQEYPERHHDGYFSVVSFNNHHDTTFSDVERVLEKASTKYDEGVSL